MNKPIRYATYYGTTLILPYMLRVGDTIPIWRAITFDTLQCVKLISGNGNVHGCSGRMRVCTANDSFESDRDYIIVEGAM